jgi:hypothetical protein
MTALFACSQSTPTPTAASSDKPSPSPSASTSASAASNVEPPRACVPKGSATSPLAHVEVAGGLATVCISAGAGAASHPCVQVDTKATKVGAAPMWAAPPSDERPPPATWSFKTKDNELKVCKADDSQCFTIKPRYKSPKSTTDAWGNAGAPAALSADGTRLFVIDGETKKGGDPGSTADLVVFADTFDVKTGRRLAHVDITSTEKKPHVFFDQGDSWWVSWVGDSVRLTSHRCCGPDGAEELLDPKTGASLRLGDPAVLMPIDGGTWLLAHEGESKQIKLVDAVAGKVIAELTIPAKAASDGPEQYMIDGKKLDAGHVFVTFANPPGVTVLDVAAKSLSTPLMLPMCR